MRKIFVPAVEGKLRSSRIRWPVIHTHKDCRPLSKRNQSWYRCRYFEIQRRRIFVDSFSSGKDAFLQSRLFSDRTPESSSAKHDHDRRVAAMQARILTKVDLRKKELQQDSLQITQHPPRPLKITPKERKAILWTIQQSLSKDPEFFNATMAAFQNSKTSGSPEPIQDVLWDKYRQLYYNSIPTFVKTLQHPEKDINNSEDFIERLQSVGFGDKKWGQAFHQVEDYQHHMDTVVESSIRRITEEVLHWMTALAKAERSLISLEENLSKEQLLQRQTMETKKECPSQKESKRMDRKLRKARLREANRRKYKKNQVTFDDMHDHIGKDHPETSLFQRAWEWVASTIGGSPGSDQISVKPPETIAQDSNHCDTLSMDVLRNKATKKKISRLQRRVEKRSETIGEMRARIDLLTADLDEAKRSKAQSKPPVPWDDYERARIILLEVRDPICQGFAEYITQQHAQSIQHFQLLDSKTDLTKPHEWYPYARLDKRKVIFHGGPTNSGKTFSALERLKQAQKGLYLGPLRLLAAEVYETLTAEGFYTNLFTGQERREIPFSTHTAATVEMCNVQEEYDVVVIDEIQMIADPSRGAAWTKALLGLRCNEIHVCGGLEAKDIVEKLVLDCGDDFELHRYDRFSHLNVSDKSLSSKKKYRHESYRNVQPGDCIVAFSRNDIFSIQREIESLTDYKCCVIYGTLPPQTRADQARRFNDPNSGYDVLVASDAIGMGLNLNIRRIIFNSIFKFNGEKIIRLGHSDIKQISGRAGRRNSPYPNGEVTCRDHRDLRYVRECLSREIEPIRKASLLPTESHIELFADALMLGSESQSRPPPDLHGILEQFSGMATVQGDFFLGRQTEMTAIAKVLKNIPIRLLDAYTMCLSPTSRASFKLLEAFASKLSQGEVCGLPLRAIPKRAKTFDDLSRLCNIYSDVELFLWLQYKFPPGNALELATAQARKEQTMEYINHALSSTEDLKVLNHCYLKAAQKHRTIWEAKNGGPGSSSRMDSPEADLDDEDGSEDDFPVAYDDDDDDDDIAIYG